VESHRVYYRKAKFGEWYWYDKIVPWPKGAPFKKPEESDLPPMPWERGGVRPGYLPLPASGRGPG
jgi:hypothetical protein